MSALQDASKEPSGEVEWWSRERRGRGPDAVISESSREAIVPSCANNIYICASCACAYMFVYIIGGFLAALNRSKSLDRRPPSTFFLLSLFNSVLI